MAEGALETLEAAMALAPRGIFLEQADDGGDVARLAARIAVAEARHGLDSGRTRIIATTGHDGASLLALASFRAASPRLAGLAFAAEALAATLCLPPESETLRIARAMTLFAANAAGVVAVAGPFRSVDDEDLRRKAAEAAALGYGAAAATSEAQAEAIEGTTVRA